MTKKINIYTPVYHRFDKTKQSLESIIDSIQKSINDIKLYVGINGIEGGENSPMEKWLNEIDKHDFVTLFKSSRNVGKAYIINEMYKKYKECDYVVSIDSDMIADENDQYNWIDELVKIMEHEPAKNFGLLSTWQKVGNCHVLKNLNQRTEFLGHWIKFGPSGIAGGCVIIRKKDFDDIGGYQPIDIYNGDDALLMRNISAKNKLIGVVETIRLTHPETPSHELNYQEWKSKKAYGKLPNGLNTKGFWDE